MSTITLSPETIKILKNYSVINQGININVGNVLRTLSISNIILGKSVILEEFDKDCAIYNLPQFIAAMESFDEPILEFRQNIVAILEKDDPSRSIEYRYADPEIIHSTDKDITMPATEVNFTLSEDELLRLLKTASVLSSPHFVVSNSFEVDSVKISVMDVDNPLSNVYSADVAADDVVDNEFKFIFKVENLIIIPGSYNIGISSQLLSNWICGDTTYWIALETSSVYNK